MAPSSNTPDIAVLPRGAAWRRLLCTASMLLSAWAPSCAAAMGVTPVTLVLDANGQHASGQIAVNNADNRKLPVELNVFKLTLTPSGEILRAPALDQFVIFPPQTVVGPKSSQIFRLQFVGDPELAESQAYEVSVDEVPVDIKNEGSRAVVQIVYSISAIVVVEPTAGHADISVEQVDLTSSPTGEVRAKGFFHNGGARHAFLSEGHVTLAATDGAGKIIWERSLNSEQIRQEIGIGYLPPHFTRALTLPFDLPQQTKGVKILFRQKQG